MKTFGRGIIIAVALFLGITSYQHFAEPYKRNAQRGSLSLAQEGKSKYSVILSQNASEAEKQAGKEFIHYFQKITGVAIPLHYESQTGNPKAAIYIGPSTFSKANGIDETTLGEEEWIIKTVGENLILTGGHPRGVLYAVYHFLEEELGVRWWTPWEERVPQKSALTIRSVNKTGKPAFFYRDIYTLYGNDKGQFAAHNRLNRQGEAAIAEQFGGAQRFGPPYFCHTFYLYVPPKKHFAEHPEWFAEINGKRQREKAQLCLTQEGLRQFYLEQLRGFIKSSKEEAQKEHLSPPKLFAVDQNDFHNHCQCASCQAIAKSEGSEAGPILDFVNWLAEKIENDHPDVYLVVLAYEESETPPQNIRPRKNVIIRLTDTTSSLIHPLVHPVNSDFRRKLENWSQKADSLMVWDYAVTYSHKTRDFENASGVPLPSLQTYQRDYQLFLARHVKGVMVEHEFPVLADMRDLKVWVMMKLLENPSLNAAGLIQDFTDGYYQEAGASIRSYLSLLETAADESGVFIGWFAQIQRHSYLDLAFISKAQAIFDEAEELIKHDPVLHKRIQFARIALDRATLIRLRPLVAEWMKQKPGNTFENFPLNIGVVARRLKQTWYETVDERKAAYAFESKDQCDKLIASALNFHAIPLPERFSAVPGDALIHLTAPEMRGNKGAPVLTADAEAPSGLAMRWEISPKEFELAGKLPMRCGVYDVENKRQLLSTSITADQIKAPGYAWYKIGTTSFNSLDNYIYLMSDWRLQCDIAKYDPSKTYDIWVNVKFDGAGYPFGGETERRSISVERIVLVDSLQM